MRDTVSDYLAALAPDLPKELISGSDLANMQRLTTCLPGALTDFLGFECRLQVCGAPADLSLCASVRNRGREILGHHPNDDFAGLESQPVWRRLFDFAALWCTSSSVLCSNVRNVWLEFDLVDPPPTIPIPNILFGSEHIRADEPREWLTQTALPLLAGSSIPRTLNENLETCIQALPPGTRVFQIGMMFAREVALIRICIRGLRGDQIPNYLDQVGWPGASEELEQTLDTLAPLVDRIDLDLDVGEQVSPKIGLECSFQDKPLPAQEPRWFAFLDYLVDRGLCLESKREALLAYPGVADEWSRRKVYPAGLLTLSALLNPRLISAFSRELHHIKITFRDGHPLEAKAYLSARHHWISTEAISRRRAAAQ